MADQAARPATEDEFRAVLTGEHPGMAAMRKADEARPVIAPLQAVLRRRSVGVGGAVLRHFGYARFAGNPSICDYCIREFHEQRRDRRRDPGHAAVRRHPRLDRHRRALPPAEFRAFLDRFYGSRSDAIMARSTAWSTSSSATRSSALFFGGVTGPASPRPASRRPSSCRALRRARTPRRWGRSRSGRACTPARPTSARAARPGARRRLHGARRLVNATARLASAALAGELLLSVDAARAADRAVGDVEHRQLDLRGRQEPLEVVVLRPVAAG